MMPVDPPVSPYRPVGGSEGDHPAPFATFGTAPASPPAVAASTGASEDVEALAQRIYEASDCYEEDGTGWESQHGAARREALAQARAVLASDWLAAQLAAAEQRGRDEAGGPR